eukprot:gene8858-9037_t
MRKVFPGRSLLVSSSPRTHRPRTWFCWDLLDEGSLYNGPAGIIGLVLFRAFALAVFAAVNIFGNVVYPAAGGRFFIYFTNWTFVMFGLTSLVLWRQTGETWSAVKAAVTTTATTATDAEEAGKMKHDEVADYTPGSPLRVDNPFKHGVSAVLLLLDFGLSATPVVSYHVQVVIAYGSVYLVFLWLYYAGSGQWVYRALDWSHAMSPAFYLATPLLLIVGFAIMYVLPACFADHHACL